MVKCPESNSFPMFFGFLRMLKNTMGFQGKVANLQDHFNKYKSPMVDIQYASKLRIRANPKHLDRFIYFLWQDLKKTLSKGLKLGPQGPKFSLSIMNWKVNSSPWSLAFWLHGSGPSQGTFRHNKKKGLDSFMALTSSVVQLPEIHGFRSNLIATRTALKHISQSLLW